MIKKKESIGRNGWWLNTHNNALGVDPTIIAESHNRNWAGYILGTLLSAICVAVFGVVCVAVWIKDVSPSWRRLRSAKQLLQLELTLSA